MAEPDLTNQYNTKLSPTDEATFQQWSTANPRLSNTYDYDARGFWKAGAGTSNNGHGSDQWKKPNHPTFSTGSQYNGIDGNQGGTWGKQPNGSWTFAPGKTNMQNYSEDDLKDYFDKVEPSNKLLLPQPAEAQ